MIGSKTFHGEIWQISNCTLPGGPVPAEQLADKWECYKIVSPDIIDHVGLQCLIVVFVCHFMFASFIFLCDQHCTTDWSISSDWASLLARWPQRLEQHTRAREKMRIVSEKVRGWWVMKDREGDRGRKMNNRISSRDQRLSLWPWSWGQAKLCQLPRIQAYREESIFMTGRSGSTISPFLIWKLSILWWKVFPQGGLHRRSGPSWRKHLLNVNNNNKR